MSSRRRLSSRCALSEPSSTTSVHAKEEVTSTKQSPLHSPSRGNDPSNIFVQMDEFSKLDSPTKRELSPPVASVTSPSRPLCSSSAGSLSITSLRSVLSLPSSALHSPKSDLAERTADGQNCTPVIDDNKNCISAEDASVECTGEISEVPAKRKKCSELSDNDVCDWYRQKYCVDRMSSLRTLHGGYREGLTELFFLQNGGNLMDYFSWKKRPNTLLACYLRSESIDEDIDGSLFLVSIAYVLIILFHKFNWQPKRRRATQG